ncbi:MAG: hypothetical protein WCF85_09765 [Rhodospirillaceae bacterium]
MSLRTAVAGTVLCVLFAAAPVAAQFGPSPQTLMRPGLAHPFPTRAVWPHEMMTYSERYDIWLKMREASSPAERYAIWNKKFAELDKRASDHGLILRNNAPTPLPREEAAFQPEGLRRTGVFMPESVLPMAGGWHGYRQGPNQDAPMNPVHNAHAAPSYPAHAAPSYGHGYGGMHPMPPPGR